MILYFLSEIFHEDSFLYSEDNERLKYYIRTDCGRDLNATAASVVGAIYCMEHSTSILKYSLETHSLCQNELQCSIRLDTCAMLQIEMLRYRGSDQKETNHRASEHL